MSERDDIRERRQALKKSYARLYDRTLAVLFKHDPIGINFETNSDEYAPEVEAILPQLGRCRDVAAARKMIHQVFVRWFSPEDAGEEHRYSAIANEVWQAGKQFEAKDPVAAARAAWAEGDDVVAGRILFQTLRSEQRPKWAADILSLACEAIAAPSAVIELLAVARDSHRWGEGHRVFDSIRALTLDQQKADSPDKRLVALLDLAEKTAKVVYNASEPTAPFDRNAGWLVAPCLRVVMGAVDGESFSVAAEAALFEIV